MLQREEVQTTSLMVKMSRTLQRELRSRGFLVPMDLNLRELRSRGVLVPAD